MVRFRARFAGGLRLLWLVIIPAAAGYVVLARPIVGALLERGALTTDAADQTARVLVAFAVGLPGFSRYLYALRGFYALGDVRTPFALAAVENLLNIVFALLLEPSGGVVGLALASSMAYASAALVAVATLERRIGRFVDRRTAGALVRVAGASAVMAVAVTAVGHVVRHSPQVIQMASGVTAGIAVFGVATSLLKVPELKDLRRAATVPFKRRAASP